MLRQRMAMGIAITAAVVAGGVGGAVLGVPGISGADSSPANTPATATAKGVRAEKSSALFDAAAKALNLTPAQLKEKLSDGKTTIADVAKQQNVDVDDVINAMTAADKDRITDIVNKPWPTRGPGGPGGLGIFGGRDHGPKLGLGGLGALGGRFGADIDALAKALNTTPEKLKTDLASGKTIKQIAEANNVDVNTVIDKIVDAANTKIDKAVTDGHLSKEQGENIKSKLKDVITDFVNDGFKMDFGHGFPWPGKTP